jgi:cysteine desulfurase
MQLDLAGVCVSLGSACASGTTQPSPVLVAMKVRDDLVKTSLRFSLNAFTTQYDIDEAVLRVTAAVERSRL